jgi:hypothetical protein
MPIELNGPFTNSGIRDEWDVRQMKKALNRLGYYVPDSNGITGRQNQKLFDALKEYQRMRKLPVTGMAAQDDATIRAINEDLETQREGNYIWRCVDDGKVRPAHRKFKDTIRAWADSPDPGEDFNCRCWAEPMPVIDDPPIEPVYPELLLLPLLRVPRLYTAWRLWRDAPKNIDWRLRDHKSSTTWGNQLRNRDWTPEQITETIKYGQRYPSPNKVNPTNSATRYQYKDHFVVRDDKTKEILQISNKTSQNPFHPNTVE